MKKFRSFNQSEGKPVPISGFKSFQKAIKKAIKKNKENRARTIINLHNNPVLIFGYPIGSSSLITFYRTFL